MRRLVELRKALKMHVVHSWEEAPETHEPVVLVYCSRDNCVKLVVGKDHFPNLQRYKMPEDILGFNGAMRYLGVKKIVCSSSSELSIFDRQIFAMPIEVGLEPKLEVA